MIKSVLFTFSILFFGLMQAQNATELVVLDEAEQSLEEHLNEFKNHQNLFVTNGIEKNAIEQILDRIGDPPVDVLKIYVSTKPGAIVFSSLAITNENLENLESDLQVLASKVNSSIEFYGEMNLFEGEEGQRFKNRIESLMNVQLIFKQK